MITKYSSRLKRVTVLFLALIMALSIPVGLQGRDLGRETTYIYIDTDNDMPIPDAFQFRNSIYLNLLVGNVMIDGEATVVQTTMGMHINPANYRVNPNWIYVTEIDMDAIIVLDENHELVRFPNLAPPVVNVDVNERFVRANGILMNGSWPVRPPAPVIRHFTTTGEFIDELFATMYPDYEIDEFGEWILNEAGQGVLRQDGILTQDAINARRSAFVLVRCEGCDNCILDNFRNVANLPTPTIAPPPEDDEEEYEEEYEEYEEEYEEEEQEPGFITPLARLRMQVEVIVTSRGFVDYMDWHYAYFDQELPCQGDYHFVTGFRRPEGVFVCRDGYFYLADTQNNRILVANPDLELTLVIYMPTSRELGGERLGTFLPASVVVDSAGRITVVARNINNGMLQFSSTGQFNRFVGAPRITMDWWESFRRRWFPGQNHGQAHVPTEYNSIRIDHNNFIWGTIGALELEDILDALGDPTHETTPIKRLNPLGDDILMRKGERGIWGDVPSWAGGPPPSRIIDVGIGPAGIYTLLDAVRGRMFTFNSEGIMLFAFGNIGSRQGNFRRPVAIGYIGHNIAVLDAGLNEIVIFEPTLYGELIIQAEYYFMAGRYQDAYDAWASAAEQNAIFSHAFFGLGNARFNDRDFTQAMIYFRHAGGDRGTEGYSRARDMIRREQMDTLFPFISAGVAIGALALVGWLIFKGIKNYALSDDVIGYDRDKGDDD